MNELLLSTVAQEAPEGSESPPGLLGAGSPLFMMLIIFGIFYFLLIRPQQKQAKEHQLKLSRLKKGDEVVTTGGLIGTIFALTDTILTLEIADKVRVRVLRGQIASLVSEGPASATAEAEKGK